MAANAIHLQHVVKGFGDRPVLRDLDLQVPEGSVTAFLGRNGSGKTTTIKLLLGLLDPEEGRVRVLGHDPVEENRALLRRIGYVSEDRALYEWMSAEEMIRFTSAFYDEWDPVLAAQLCDRLGIDRDQRIRKMSRGEKGKLSLLLGLAHRPRLLILDEPTAGLDAVVRRQFIEETIELVAQEGRTVFFSSHLIDEVERIADHVTILSEGRIVLNASMDEIKGRFRRIKAHFGRDVLQVRPPEGALNFRRFERHVLFLSESWNDEAARFLREQGADRIDVDSMCLDEVFVETTREETR